MYRVIGNGHYTAQTHTAAARLTESLGAALRKLPLTGAQKALIPTEASTLHRLLGAQPGSQRMRYHAGNPLHLDPREVNVVKGDGKCASIAAASLVAKVARDHVMEAYAEQYPGYGFESNKGYGSEGHMAAIRERGLCPIHRRSFCSFAAQESLF